MLVAVTPPQPTPQIRVEDHRWAAVRFLARTREYVSVAQGNNVLAVIPYRLACLMRVLVIASLFPIPAHLINENDVAAVMCAWVVSGSVWPHMLPGDSFPGDHHEFAPHDYYCEPGFLRPAYIPQRAGQLHYADPLGSAFLDVTGLGSTLCYHFFINCGHPLGIYMANCIRFGFPAMARPHSRSTFAPSIPVDPVHLDRARQLVQREFDIGAFHVVDFPRSVPLRRAPYFFTYVPEKDKLRPVGHFSFGDDSLNGCTDRRALPRAILGQIKDLVQHVLHWHRVRPGVPVFIFKFDADNAFRWWPAAARDFAAMVHRVFGVDVANIRLAMGAVASADHMSWGPTIIAHLAWHVFGIRVTSYIDDQGVASPADRVWFDACALYFLWAMAGIPFSHRKWPLEGLPSTTKSFLGVEVDTVNMTLALPAAKRDKLISMLRGFLDDPAAADQRFFRSLAGSLTFAAAVIPLARAFTKSMFTAAYCRGDIPHAVLQRCMLDAEWWVVALTSFNGTATFRPPTAVSIAFHVASDACKHGWGILSPELGVFAQGTWSLNERLCTTIAMLEGFTAVMGVAELAPLATGRILVFHTDSWAAFKAYAGQRAHHQLMYLLMRFVSLLQLRFRCLVVWRHRIGLENGGPDELSRKEKPPPWTRSYQRFEVRSSVRTFGGMLDWPWRERASQTKLLESLPQAFSTLTTIVSSLDTPSPSTCPMPWIHSKSTLMADPLFAADSSTSLAISCGTRAPKLGERCDAILATCASTGVRCAVGDMLSAVSRQMSSTAGGSCLSSDVSGSQRPSSSSSGSWTTQASISLSEPPSSSHSMLRSAVLSTWRSHVQRMTPNSACNAATSPSTGLCHAQPLQSSYVSQRLITPTPASGRGYRQHLTRTTAPRTGYAATSRPPATPAPIPVQARSSCVTVEALSPVPTSRRHCASTGKHAGWTQSGCPATHCESALSSKCAMPVCRWKQSRLWHGGQHHQHRR